MNWKTTYNDLCKEIEILELRASDLEYQMRIAKSICFRGYATNQRSRVPLDKALISYDDVKDELLGVVAILEHKQMTKRQIEQKMNEFDGLEYQVAFRRDVMRQPLDKIANELGYSYNWILKISSRTSRLKGRKKAETA